MGIIEFDSVFNYIMDMHMIYPVVEGRVTMLNFNKSDFKPSDVTPVPASVPGDATHLSVSMSLIFFAIVTLINLFL